MTCISEWGKVICVGFSKENSYSQHSVRGPCLVLDRSGF